MWTHKLYNSCKGSKGDLSLAVWDDKLGGKIKDKFKSNDNTNYKKVEVGNTWDLENTTKEAYKKNLIVTLACKRSFA